MNSISPAFAFLYPLARAYLARREDDAVPALKLAVAYRAKREIDPTLAVTLADQLAQLVIESPPARLPLSLEVELERIVPIAIAADLQGTSPDTIEREDERRIARGEPSQLIALSARRKGIRLKHALKLV